MMERVTINHNPLELTQPDWYSQAACNSPNNTPLFQEAITQEFEQGYIDDEIRKLGRKICNACEVFVSCYNHFLYEDTRGITAGQTTREWENDRKNQNIKV